MTSTRFSLFGLLLILCISLLVLGCESSEDNSNIDGDTEQDSSTENDTEPELEKEAVKMPVAKCGMKEYELLDKTELGEPLEFEAMLLWDLDAKTIDSMIAAAGYGDFAALPYGAKLYKYRYTTQDKGKKVEATGIIAIPTGDIKEKTRHTILSLHGTTGWSDPCAPSRSQLEGPALPAFMAANGYISVAPDYIGMTGFGKPASVRHAYLVGEQLAIGAWDSVRAAEKLLATKLDTGLKMSGKVIPWGGSQGGHASLFAELYAPYYADEYEVPCVMALIPPTTLLPFIKEFTTNFGHGTGLLAAVYTTMALWYDQTALIKDVFTNEEPYFFADNITEGLFPTEECNAGDSIKTEKIEEIYLEKLRNTIASDKWEELGAWDCFFKENSLSTTSIKPLRYTPTLLSFGEKDELIVTKLLHDDIKTLCGMGYKFDYLECAHADHVEGGLWSIPEQLEWMKNRIDGKDISSDKLCKINEPVCCGATPKDTCTK